MASYLKKQILWIWWNNFPSVGIFQENQVSSRSKYIINTCPLRGSVLGGLQKVVFAHTEAGKEPTMYSLCLNIGVSTMADMDSSTFPQGLSDGLQSTRYSRGSKGLTLPILTWHIKPPGIDYLNNVLLQRCCNQSPISVRVLPRITFLSVCSIRTKPKPSVFQLCHQHSHLPQVNLQEDF